jgi:hypothetical protein
MLYEDDGITTGYQNGKSAQTKLRFSRNGNRYTLLIAPTEGEFEKQPAERSYVLELPATAKAESVLVDGVAIAVDYVEAESMNRISVPARSIRKGCQVVVQAAQISADELSRRALVQRAGLPMPARELSSSDLLARALETAKDHAHRSALLASVGIGVFGRNKNVYGFPEEHVPQLFESDRFGAKVVAVKSEQDPLRAKTSQIYRVEIAGRLLHQFTIVEPVDFKSFPGNITPQARITLSSGQPASGLVDGIVGGYPDRMEQEWTSNAEKANAWASFTWNAPHKVDRVVLFDRPNLDDHVLSGRIEFSDGTITTFGELDNPASHGTEIQFDPRTVTSMKIVLDAVGPKTVNIGLAEVVVHECK